MPVDGGMVANNASVEPVPVVVVVVRLNSWPMEMDRSPLALESKYLLMVVIYPIQTTASDTDGWRGGNGGGGSGGAIRLSANNITNNGLLSVTGGDRYHPTYGGAGGGGRIAMIARKALVPGQYDVSGGRNTEGDIIAGDGTIYVEAGEGGMSVLNAPSGSLVIDGSGGSILYSVLWAADLHLGRWKTRLLLRWRSGYLLLRIHFYF